MVAGTLVAVGVVNALTAAAFATVGLHLARRDVDAPDRLALRAIAAWWLCMAAILGIQALEVFAALGGGLDLALSTAFRFTNGMLLGIGCWGLCFHVMYLRSGNRAWAFRLAPYFVLLGVAYWASVVYHPLIALEPGAYEVRGVHDPPLEGSTLWTAVLAGVGLPLIGACIVYLVLSRHLTQRDQRRRAVLASSGILSWVATSLVAQLTGVPWADFLTYTVFGLAAGILVLLAYFPPEFLRRDDPAGTYMEVRRDVPLPTPDSRPTDR